MKIGVFTVMLPDLTPEEAAAELRGAGYDGIEWRVTEIDKSLRGAPPSFWGNNLCTLEPTPEEAARARTLAQRERLELVGLTTYLQVGDVAATENAMRVAKLAGAPQIRVGVGTPEGGYVAAFERALSFLTAVAELARHYGVKALVETHHKTITPSASLAQRLVSPFDPELIGVIYDPGNMVHEGYEDYRLGLELLGPHLAHVHLKNARFVRSKDGIWRAMWSPLEDGVVDFGRFLSALRAVGYDGWLVIEDFSAAQDSRSTLRHNLQFVKALLAAPAVSA